MVSQSSPSAVATRARTRTSDQSRPYAPAFMRTPAPAVPGIAHANSRPPRPASRARCRHTAFVAPPPARRTTPSISTAASSSSRRSTSASTPSSETSRFEPSPTGRTARPSSRAKRSASTSSASECGRAKARAGPPTPIVVSLASGNAVLDPRHSGSPSTIERAIRHGSPTPSVTTTSPGRAHARASADASSRRRRPPTPRRRGHVVEDELARDARKRCVATTDHVGHDRRVRDPERGAQLVVELPRPLVDVRLIDGDERARLERSSAVRKRRGELRRVVAVVVDHPHAAPLADELEAPSDAGKGLQRALRVASLDPREPEHGKRRRSVRAVVLARDSELAGNQLELPATDGIRRSCEPVVEERGELRLRGVRRRDGRARRSSRRRSPAAEARSTGPTRRPRRRASPPPRRRFRRAAGRRRR